MTSGRAHRLAEDGPQLLGCGLSDIAEVNLVVRAGELETLVREERGVHPLKDGTFGVKGTDMQRLGAAPLGE